ncbi:MAG: HlyD family type I secretion periplasmic adaptor subunit [Gammaproteobacteria bacterium SHHR-1]|uniref:HlyD family type I secretion periplasmic adaptor subunit n=1 Tax=Magnetovirga frankeli TaxID=947516 RepID=UPI00129382C3|nr:HlyD family type I secretion periplasmic adaptor subunit [gamma proteobacterium SS-5]
MSQAPKDTETPLAKPAEGETQIQPHSARPQPEPEADEFANTGAPDSNDRKYRRFGNLVLLVMLGGLAAWSVTAPIDSAVLATGQVKVESNRKTVQHLEGGLVSEIAVSDGDYVDKGQLLLKLDDVQSRVQLDIVRWQFYNEQTKLARLQAERDGLDKIEFPEVADQDFDQSELDDLRQQETRLFDFRQRSMQGEIDVLENRIEQLGQQIEGLEAVSRIKQDRIVLSSDEIAEWQSLYDRQLADKQQLRQIEHQKLSLEGEVAQHKADIARLKIQIGEAKSQILLLKQQFLTDVLAQLRESLAALADFRVRMISLSDRVERTTITAPDSGLVVGMDIHTLGAVISPGTPIMHIVPQSQKFVVDARIETTDIDRVFPKQPADIRFSAFDMTDTPVIEGEVQRVSADSLVDEHSGVPYYEVKVLVTGTGMQQMQEYNLELMSGMPAEVMIKAGARTFAQYLVQPISNMFARAFKEE